MQYSTILLSALAATGALAAPARRQVDNSIRVQLSNQAIELGSGTNFEEAQLPETKRPVGSSGPFDTVLLTLGANVDPQTLRCQVLDDNNDPIVVLRGQNTEITFADGGAGEWTFRDGATIVSSITCDPTFVKGGLIPAPVNADLDLDIRVQLSDGNLAVQRAFDQAGLIREVQTSPDSQSLFNIVSLSIGADVQDQALRCQILDAQNDVITLLRNGNVATTFAGGEEWTFEVPEQSQVSTIICDPAF